MKHVHNRLAGLVLAAGTALVAVGLFGGGTIAFARAPHTITGTVDS